MTRINDLTYQQQHALVGLRWIGGFGGRRAIADACGLDCSQVAYALTGLEEKGLVENAPDRTWHLTDAGATLAPPSADPEPDPKPWRAPPPRERRKPTRERMCEELGALRAAPPDFSPADAAWLCRALCAELRDMPNVTAMLARMADYWEHRCRNNATNAGITGESDPDQANGSSIAPCTSPIFSTPNGAGFTSQTLS